MILAASAPLLPSTSLLQELNKVNSKQENFNHGFPALLTFLTTLFNIISLNVSPQIYLRFKVYFSSNEARS